MQPFKGRGRDPLTLIQLQPHALTARLYRLIHRVLITVLLCILPEVSEKAPGF